MLIVNADDYGLTPEVSYGIRSAHQNGIVTSTTAMMNTETVVEDLKQASVETPKLGIGVHLILTAGSPILPPSEVPTLVDSSGRFPKIGVIYEAVRSLKQNHVYKEWRAQIEKLLSIGVIADHLDSHHHVSYLHPMLFEVMLQIADEYQLPIRHIPLPSTLGLIGVIPKDLDQYQKASGVRSTQRLVTSFYGGTVSFNTINSILKQLDQGVTELMCHPGYADDQLKSKSSYNHYRAIELKVLIDPETRTLIKKQNIHLSTFSIV